MTIIASGAVGICSGAIFTRTMGTQSGKSLPVVLAGIGREPAGEKETHQGSYQCQLAQWPKKVVNGKYDEEFIIEIP